MPDLVKKPVARMAATPDRRQLAADDRAKLLETLEARFAKNSHRHPGLEWAKVRARLRALREMEGTGGEPDVVGQDAKPGELYHL